MQPVLNLRCARNVAGAFAVQTPVDGQPRGGGGAGAGRRRLAQIQNVHRQRPLRPREERPHLEHQILPGASSLALDRFVLGRQGPGSGPATPSIGPPWHILNLDAPLAARRTGFSFSLPVQRPHGASRPEAPCRFGFHSTAENSHPHRLAVGSPSRWGSWWVATPLAIGVGRDPIGNRGGS